MSTRAAVTWRACFLDGLLMWLADGCCGGGGLLSPPHGPLVFTRLLTSPRVTDPWESQVKAVLFISHILFIRCPSVTQLGRKLALPLKKQCHRISEYILKPPWTFMGESFIHLTHIYIEDILCAHTVLNVWNTSWTKRTKIPACLCPVKF